MKTVTEFDGFQLKNALARKKELAQAGKSEEEVQQGISESFKAEGDKLKFLMNAMAHLEEKKATEGVKRVLVMSLDEEKEKAPSGASKKDDHYFMVELFPGAQKPKFEGKSREGKFGKGGKGKDRKGRRPRGRRDEKPREAGEAGRAGGAPAARIEPGKEGEKRRPPRKPFWKRGPRQEGPASPEQLAAKAGVAVHPKPGVIRPVPRKVDPASPAANPTGQVISKAPMPSEGAATPAAIPEEKS